MKKILLNQEIKFLFFRFMGLIQSFFFFFFKVSAFFTSLKKPSQLIREPCNTLVGGFHKSLHMSLICGHFKLFNTAFDMQNRLVNLLQPQKSSSSPVAFCVSCRKASFSVAMGSPFSVQAGVWVADRLNTASALLRIPQLKQIRKPTNVVETLWKRH